tara:strand:- start:162 stop:422 length:261 start_codon:yes stop_codon:yes gene_type:complete
VQATSGKRAILFPCEVLDQLLVDIFFENSVVLSIQNDARCRVVIAVMSVWAVVRFGALTVAMSHSVPNATVQYTPLRLVGYILAQV